MARRRRRRRRRSGGLLLAAIVAGVALAAGGSVKALAPSGPGHCSGIGSVPASMINGAARDTGISCAVVRAQISKESGGSPSALSPAGAEGVAQFEPYTWKADNCAGSPWNVGDAMTCYVTEMRKDLQANGGNLRDALAAYNAGQGNLSAGFGYADAILAAG